MRIGIMLRAIDEKGGIGVYSHNITKELLELDQANQYVLFYRTSTHLGRFAGYPNAKEILVRAPHKAIWDQVAIPFACWRHQVDVLFHPKFTVPVFAPCQTAMVLHGAGWFMPEHSHYWGDMDLNYLRRMMPIYCSKASVILAVSKITADVFYETFDIPEGKIKPVYFAPGKQFKLIKESTQLARVQADYRLPEQFILHLTGYDRGPRKNFKGVLEAFKKVHNKIPHKLVVAGRDGYKFREDFDIPEDGYGADILFLGWIEQDDLPAVYSLADLFLYPSWVEAFPIPVTEALSCGTPVITSDANGMKEIAADAAYLVDPADPNEIAEAIERVLSNRQLHTELSKRGLERARRFDWRRCAEETLGILQTISDEVAD